MTEPFITVKQGGVDIDDGVYPVQLTKISDPKTVTAQRGPKAGEDIQLIDWIFTVDDPGSTFDGTELAASTSTASGPKSKMFAYLTALLGGKSPQVGQQFGKDDLVGRLALATIRKDESGWPRIENLSALPAQMAQRSFARQTGTPTTEAVPEKQPIREAVAAGQNQDGVPF